MTTAATPDEDGRPTPAHELRAYLAAQPQRRPMRQRPLMEVRRDIHDWALEVGGRPEPVAAIDAVDADGVPGRLYRPAGDEHDVLVWLHGGAWMLGDLDTCDRIARTLANRSSAAILTVDYRLAPEHPFPAAIDDAWTALTWADTRFDAVAVGGDSAGGNLAAAAALRARDAGRTLVAQLLVYPLVDCAVDSAAYYRFGRAYTDFAGSPGFGAASEDDLRFMWDAYTPDPAHRLLPDAVPMRAASLRDLAPAVVITAEHDILRHDGQLYARWLATEGVPVEHHDYAGQIHGFFHMLGILSAAHDAVDKCAAALQRAVRSSRVDDQSPGIARASR